MSFFKGKQGLRQFDPLSPYLFIIMQEVFSRLLKNSFETGKIGQFVQARGTPIISHLMYADNIVIFANGGKRSMRVLMEVLNKYEEWTGQVLSKEKSAIFFSKKISVSRKHALLCSTGFTEGSFPFTYLGVPIVDGRLKACDFGDLLGKVNKKIAGWKMKILSAGGRTIMLRHVLSSIATHLLAVLDVPKVVIRSLNKLLSSFFWGESGGKSRRKWISWKYICTPTDEGGLGIRDFGDVQRALHMKLAWNLIKGNSLWAEFFGGPLYAHFPVTEHSLIKINECRIENGWDISLLNRLVGHQKANELYEFLARRKEGEDALVWLKDKEGNFTTKSA
ncbi:hypothetical protein F2P56_006657 [Juglans regia]|uniref:Reverse transcriptase domain-containing protein n=1 Tax=Juglans regia TaxID=51240 RepID=A0A833Y033_JUGRE|nr:hypothetical protein F2P56_006657 [Juglans regia]